MVELTAKDELALTDLGAQGNVLLRGARGSLGGGHLDCDPVVSGLVNVVPSKCSARRETVGNFGWVR